MVNEQSGVKFRRNNAKRTPVLYNEESEFFKCYFNKDMRLYTDKLARFVFRANKKSFGNVIDRISRIYPTIFIDEVQDLAGYDLEILKLLYHSSSTVYCVGDPRQVTYYTHWERKNEAYRNGRIKEYVEKECYKRDKIQIDDETLCMSHRNNQQICDFSSKLYPSCPKVNSCNCSACHNVSVEHQGIYIVKKSDLERYLAKYNPVQLRYSISTKTSTLYRSQNFGQSKGKTYDRVIIYPTNKIMQWLKDNSVCLPEETRSKLYVAITRARYSVAFLIPDEECDEVSKLEIWNDETRSKEKINGVPLLER